MLSLWNLYLLLPLSMSFSLHAITLTGENVEETQQLDTDTAVQHLTQPSQRPHGSGLATVNSTFGPEDVDYLGLPLNWPLSSSEESDRQGVIGEYTDLQESTETSLWYPNEKGLFISRPTESATVEAISKESTQPLRSSSGAVHPLPTQEQTLRYQPAETSTGSKLHSTQTGENQLTLPASQNDTADSYLPFLLSGSIPSESPDQDSTSALPAVGPGSSPEPTTPPIATGGRGWTRGLSQGKTQEGTLPVKETGDITDHILHSGDVSMEAEKGKSPSLNDIYSIWGIHY